MKKLLMLFALFAMLPASALAQEAPDIEGREARVWPDSAKTPIEGRVRVSDVSMLRLDTDDVYCGIEGCVRSFSVAWPDISRLQVGERSTGERLLRIGTVAAGIALLMGPGISWCNGQDTGDDVGKCRERMAMFSLGLGAAGFFVSRQSWEDVDLPE